MSGSSLRDRVLAARANPRRTEKPCCICGTTKPLIDYHLGWSTVDGRVSACKTCANARTREWVRNEKRTEKVPVTSKVCSACCAQLPAEAFHRHINHTDGLQTYCKDCQSRLVSGETVADIRDSFDLPTLRTRMTYSVRKGVSA